MMREPAPEGVISLSVFLSVSLSSAHSLSAADSAGLKLLIGSQPTATGMREMNIVQCKYKEAYTQAVCYFRSGEE